MTIKTIQQQEEILDLIKAVAHIGVDFGYGKYELEQKYIDTARLFYENSQDKSNNPADIIKDLIPIVYPGFEADENSFMEASKFVNSEKGEEIITSIIKKNSEVKNDEQKLVSLLIDFGVEFEEKRYGNGLTHIKCSEGDNKVEGHVSFFTIFEFKVGKFIGMGAWE